MNRIEAKILFENLLNRLETDESGSKLLRGTVTPRELKALHTALSLLDPHSPEDIGQHTNYSSIEAQENSKLNLQNELVTLKLEALDSPSTPSNMRICIDFGTAMSKATLIVEREDEDDPSLQQEEIQVLELGVPGEQEEISRTMLVSSVYIDNEGLLRFGKAGRSFYLLEMEHSNTLRRVLNNIKRGLSEDLLDESVHHDFNPTNTRVSYGDLTLAYLMYLTWAVNEQLSAAGYSCYLPRRYAMPCLDDTSFAITYRKMERFLGEAQVLSDTFREQMNDGIPITKFMSAISLLRKHHRNFNFVLDPVTEPLGVANSILDRLHKTNSIVMVIDVGAGTSDFGLFHINIDPENDVYSAIEVGFNHELRQLKEAGNFLDRALMEHLIKRAGIEEIARKKVNLELETRIQDFKESLFNDGSVSVEVGNEFVDVELDEFVTTPPVISFRESLIQRRNVILENVGRTWIERIRSSEASYLSIVATGGGCRLPMVQELLQGEITIQGIRININAGKDFPDWIAKIDPNLEEDYPRTAVSIGGARSSLIRRVGVAFDTATPLNPPILERHQITGQ